MTYKCWRCTAPIPNTRHHCPKCGGFARRLPVYGAERDREWSFPIFLPFHAVRYTNGQPFSNGQPFAVVDRVEDVGSPFGPLVWFKHGKCAYAVELIHDAT